ncbi:MAG: DUF4097 family beta strand repeat-containing protein [Peptococcaceae bacterium]
MRLRTLRIWKRLKPLWLLLIGWTICSGVILFLLGYSLFDVRGGLPKVEAASSQTIEASAVKAIEIYAEGATVEVASSYDIKKIKVQLYGPGYVNQRATWQLDDDGRLTLRLDRYPITANAYGSRYEDELTMRILLPKRSYDEIAISGDRMNAAFYQCKGKQLSADVAYGSIYVYKADLQKADLFSNTSDIDIQRSRIHYLNIENQAGDTTLLDNTLRYWSYTSKSGDLDALAGKINGIWELSSQRGDIHIGTKKWHTNLLLDLHTDAGTITASSKKKPWKETIPDALTQHDLLLLEGRGENMLLVESQEGNIVLDTVKFTE